MTSSETSSLGVAARDRLVLAGLVVTNLVVRIASLRAPEGGGDAFTKWNWAKLASHGIHLPVAKWDHHVGRFGVNGPVYMLQWLFGTDARLYYVLPVLMSVVQVVALWRIGLLLNRRWVGFAAAVVVMLSPPLVRAGGQLLPAAFSGAYVLLAVWFFIRHYVKPAPARAWLVGSALWVFAAYMTKLPNVFFVPGFLLAALLVYRKPVDAVVFLGVFVGCWAVETSLYAALSDFELGRISLIKNNHLTSRRLVPLEFWELLDRYGSEALDDFQRRLLFAFVTSAALVLLLGRQRGPGTLTMLLVAGSFYAGTTFAVKSFDPLVPVQPFRDRYLVVVLPLAVLSVGLNLAHFIEVGVPRDRLRIGPGFGYGVLLMLALLWARWNDWPERWDGHVLAELGREQALVNRAFQDGTPIVAKSKDARPVELVRAILLQELNDPAYESRQARVFSVRLRRHRYFFLMHQKYVPHEAKPARLKKLLNGWIRKNRAVVAAQMPKGGRLVQETRIKKL